MIQAVLDANTIVSGMVRFHDGSSPPVLVLRHWINGRFTLIVSDHLLDEVTRTLFKPYFQSHVEHHVYADIMQALTTSAVHVSLTHITSGLASHPEDDWVISTAESAQADYLVTGDKQLQRLRQLDDIVIVSPRDFLTALEK